MKQLKKPLVAFILSLLIVFGSTSLSVNAKLNNKADQLSQILYEGVSISGEDYPEFYTSMRELCNITDDICLIANNYGIYTDELSSQLDHLQSALLYSDDDLDYLGYCYNDYKYALDSVLLELDGVGLSERHTASMAEYNAAIASAYSTIAHGSEGYNQVVRKFMSSLGSSSQAIADFFGFWDYPDYFDNY